jgi:hypothetical protein
MTFGLSAARLNMLIFSAGRAIRMLASDFKIAAFNWKGQPYHWVAQVLKFGRVRLRSPLWPYKISS